MVGKIVTIVRTLNEERNIGKYCWAFQNISDMILVADGGSTDNTVSIAKEIPKVKVRTFDKRVELQNGYWRNPDWEHINFLIEWAEDEGAEWIIFEDADDIPNYLLKASGWRLFEEAKTDIMLVTDIFLWGKDKHLIGLSQPGTPGVWQPSLWAWRANQQIRTFGDPPHFMFCYKDKFGEAIDFDKLPHEHIMPPYCRLHYNWITPEIAMSHVDYYRKSGLIPNMLHPLEFGGRLEPLLYWMKE